MEDNIEYVTCDTVSCSGDKDSLEEHPLIYMQFGDGKEVVCNYCGKKFLRAQEDDKNS